MNWALLFNSLMVSNAAALLAVGLGLAVALALAGVGARWRGLGLAAAAVALALPPFLAVNAWIDLLGRAGAWRSWLPLDIYSPAGVVGLLALWLWPIPLFAAMGSWRRLQAVHLEVEPQLKGVTLVRSLLLPAAQPALDQAALLCFVLALGNFAVPAILQVRVYPAEIWVQFNTTFDYGAAAVTSWPLWVAPLVLVCWLRRESIAWPGGEGIAAGLWRRRLGRAWHSMVWAATGWVLGLALCVPLVQLVGTAGTWRELGAALGAGRGAMVASVELAAGAATVAMGIGLATWRLRAGGLLWVTFLVPGILLGLALVYLVNRTPLAAIPPSLGVAIGSLALRYAAVSRHCVQAARSGVDHGLRDVARLDGANVWQRWRHVEWPQAGWPLLAGWYVVYLLCLWDVETLVLLVPPGGETLALRVFNLLHYGHHGQVNALCLLLLGLAVAPLAAAGLVRAAWCWVRRRGMEGAAAAGLGGMVVVALGAAGCGPAPSGRQPVASQLFSHVEVIGTRGAGPGQFNKPRSVAVDAEDNVYVVDLTGRVQKFSPRGEYLLAWQMHETDLGKPKGMACDRAGRIVVIEPHYSKVNHFTAEGQLALAWGRHGTNAGELAFPRSVAVDSGGDLWVSEYGVVDRVQRFSADGSRYFEGIGHFGGGLGELNRPEGLGIDAQDRLYVADSCNHRIQVYDPAGGWVRSFGSAGSGRGELSYPYDVRVDAEGHRFVCEFGNSRVQVFDARDQVLEVIGGPGSAPGRFNNPWSLCLNSAGDLYVADANNHRVQKFLRRAGTHPAGATGSGRSG
ncbi:MAG TPA: hypothetical protein PKM73_03985 [Verrucomicrobiota bacterium]|nr:hypothetical protein [Verrucomicrobiota bacterium]HNU50990.1 hypothetical protein [Verrucomicrobiota bacterium]